ncbi:dihydrofolate reductase family protein [Micromonospora sp. DT47]|uniref:dihydrofolate reductase family protein n=1 Tax=Micromonospora sp. DT47 TaxID=3393431 RepID=UPI003CF36CDC
MRKVIANEWMTLDGVVQAPSYADEDMTGGFGHGGWHARYFDDLSMNWVIENVRGAGGYLLGRGTYEIFAAHWPSAPEEQQVLAQPLNALPKYVASTTLDEPLGWQNSTLLRGDIGTESNRRPTHYESVPQRWSTAWSSCRTGRLGPPSSAHWRSQ